VTGAVVDTADEAVLELPHVIALDRHAVRRRFEQRFSATRMATDYVALYRSLLGQRSVWSTNGPCRCRDRYWKKSEWEESQRYRNGCSDLISLHAARHSNVGSSSFWRWNSLLFGRFALSSCDD
jgi:hypothetical protein